MFKRIILITVFIWFLSQNHLAYSQQWSEESARQVAFSNIEQNTDVASYAIKDPNYEENIKALSENKTRIANRFVTPNPEPPINYVVSELDANGMQIMTTYYDKEGIPLVIRLFSSSAYPRAGYIYCVTGFTDTNGKIHTAGELLSVHFQVSGEEVFYFNPQGKCTYHNKS